MLAAAQDHRQAFAVFGPEGGVAFHELGKTEHGVERGAQLVADVGQEGAFGAARFLGLAAFFERVFEGPHGAHFGFERLTFRGAQLFDRLGQLGRTAIDQGLQLAAGAFEAGEAPADATPHQAQGCQGIKAHGPPGLPGGRQDLYRQSGPFVVPFAVRAGGGDAEEVGAGIEVGEGRRSFFRGLRPALVKTFEAESVAVFFRGGEVERREFDRKRRIAVVEHDFGRIVRQGFRAQRPIAAQDAGDDHWGRGGVGAQLVGEKGVETAVATKKQLAAPAAIMGPEVELVVLQTVAGRIGSKMIPLRIENVKAAVGRKPKLTGGVRLDAEDRTHEGAFVFGVGVQAGFAFLYVEVVDTHHTVAGASPEDAGGVDKKRKDLQILRFVARLAAFQGYDFTVVPGEVGDTGVGADKNAAVLGFGQGGDGIAGQAARVVGIVAVVHEFPARFVETIEPAALIGSDPQAAAAVFEEDRNRIGIEAARIFRVVTPGFEAALFGMVTLQTAALGANKKVAAGIGCQRHHRFVGQTVFFAQRGEFSAAAVESIETAAQGGDVERFADFGKTEDPIGSDPGGFPRAALDMRKRTGGRIPDIGTTTHGADPEQTGTVAIKSDDHFFRQTAGIGAVLAVVLETSGGLVEEVDAGIGTDPDAATLVLDQRPHGRIAEPESLTRRGAEAAKGAGIGRQQVETTAGADPDAAFAVFEKGTHIRIAE